jgi:hypothetical protein
MVSQRNRPRKPKGQGPGPRLAHELFSELIATYYEDDPSEYLHTRIEVVTLMLASEEDLRLPPGIRRDQRWATSRFPSCGCGSGLSLGRSVVSVQALGPGNRNTRRVAPNGLSSSEAVPPCSSACWAASANPRPEPECEALDPRVKRSNIVARSSTRRNMGRRFGLSLRVPHSPMGALRLCQAASRLMPGDQLSGH